MSKKHRGHSQRRSLPWALIIGGGILLIAAALLFANRAGGGAGSSSGDSGTPQIVVDQQKIDYGYVKYGNDKQFTIKVTNTGDGVLRFTKKPYVEVLEGC